MLLFYIFSAPVPWEAWVSTSEWAEYWCFSRNTDYHYARENHGNDGIRAHIHIWWQQLNSNTSVNKRSASSNLAINWILQLYTCTLQIKILKTIIQFNFCSLWYIHRCDRYIYGQCCHPYLQIKSRFLEAEHDSCTTAHRVDTSRCTIFGWQYASIGRRPLMSGTHWRRRILHCQYTVNTWSASLPYTIGLHLYMHNFRYTSCTTLTVAVCWACSILTFVQKHTINL